ncbi:peptidase M20 [marine bacterium AO1-C]|nr:peptidase M20 [marine bacterium AO1-C]
MDQQTLIHFRRTLHQYPEVANEEYQTAQRVVDFLKEFPPHQLLEQVGGTGIVATYESDHPGKHILIRCELDALPIAEINDFAYKSTIEGKGHKCGHDGHMTMVAGLAPKLLDLPKGKVSLLFQPAEETGEGALQMLQDPQFAQIKPDYAFALHNMPGHPLHTILVKTDTFCAASKGMIVQLKGKTSHAAEPQNGISPALAMAEIVQMLDSLPHMLAFEDFTLVTVVHALLGEVAFGVAPGDAEVRATLRTFANADMDKLTQATEQKAEEIAQKYGLNITIDYTEQFAATVNDAQSVEVIKKVAESNKFSVTEMEQPNKWSEDFGQFIAQVPGALFGVGSGEHHPQLHNPDYDFPDELLETGINMFWGIIQELL